MTLEEIVIAQKRVREESRMIRTTLGVSIRDIAREVGVSSSSICRWERGAKCRAYPAVRYMRILDGLVQELENA